MTNSITEGQKTYLEGLRAGDPTASEIVVTGPPLSAEAQARLSIFKTFLARTGHPAPQPDDLYLTVSRDAFAGMLQYANDRQCLLLQCCFGFDITPTTEDIELIPPGGVFRSNVKKVGRMLLINKGNFQDDGRHKDEDFFHSDTVYRNQAGDKEHFLNLNPGHSLSESEASGYLINFRSMYLLDHVYTLGYPLPVRALLTIINDKRTALGTTNTFTFRWGLTADNLDKLGNFTLTIGTDDLVGKPVIVFKSDITIHAAAKGNTPCPPNTGC